MGLSFHYEFAAPGNVPASELETFLREIEQLAQSLGFNPTTVLNVPFDTPERRAFSRRLHSGTDVEDARLKGACDPRADQVERHDPTAGAARLIPIHGVVLVITDEHQRESCFGFLRFPESIEDIHGNELAQTGLNHRWVFRDFSGSPDPRYRTIVAKFRERGFVQSMRDEFAPLK